MDPHKGFKGTSLCRMLPSVFLLHSFSIWVGRLLEGSLAWDTYWVRGYESQGLMKCRESGLS